MRVLLTLVIAATLYFSVFIVQALPIPIPKPKGKIAPTVGNKLDAQDLGTEVKNVKEGLKTKIEKSIPTSSSQQTSTSDAGEHKNTEGDGTLLHSKMTGDGESDDHSHSSANIVTMVKKCSDVVCAPPPQNGNCETSNDPSLNVMSYIMGPLSECCQLWICTSPTDGSFFTHYGITSIGLAHDFGNAAPYFISQHKKNSKTFGQLNLIHGGLIPGHLFESDRDNVEIHPPGHEVTAAAAGFTGQMLSPPMHSMPFPMMPIIPMMPWNAPQPPQPTFSAWGVFRGERERRSVGSPVGPGQQNFDQPRMNQHGPSEPNNFPRFPIQVPQFL